MLKEIKDVKDQKSGLVWFQDFLRSIDRKKILVGFNSKTYDKPVLLNKMQKYNLHSADICGFSDTMMMTKSSCLEKLPSYKLSEVVKALGVTVRKGSEKVTGQLYPHCSPF